MPVHIRDATPRSLGFSQPAEWVPHAATWAAWPFGVVDWHGALDGARKEFANLVSLIAQHEPVRLLLADDESEESARRHLDLGLVSSMRVPLDDVWLRDSGPTFVARDDGAVSFVHWRFDAWGGKFHWKLDDDVPELLAEALDVDHFDADFVLEGGAIETNGRGVGITTRQCLLSRSPDLDWDGKLRDHLGYEHLIWLDRGLEGDHTDGHVDTIARFVDESTIVAAVCEDRGHPNHLPLRENLETLKAACDGRFRVVEVPLPRALANVPQTYVNFCLVNGAVIVPQYDDPPNDDRAVEIIQGVFPDRKVIGSSSKWIIWGGGSFHCLTQQQPAGPMWRGEYRP